MRPEIVAEVSGNHGQVYARVVELICHARLAGADAVKFQCWTPGKMTMGASRALTEGIWKGSSPEALYAAAWTPWPWFPDLFALVRKHGMQPFASVFDHEALAFLEREGCERYKIASAEIIDLPLIEAVAKTGKPMVMSTGMASRQEIHEAWEAATLAGCTDLTILHCVSAYPTGPAGVNMNTMLHLGELYRGRALIGFSDHTKGIAASVTAAALGASMVEKHIKVHDQAIDGEFSLYPEDFARLVRECKAAAAMMGVVSYGPQPGDASELRRGVYFKADLLEGHVIRAEDIVTARPATATVPRDIPGILGGRLKRFVKAGWPVGLESITPPPDGMTQVG